MDSTRAVSVAVVEDVASEIYMAATRARRCLLRRWVSADPAEEKSDLVHGGHGVGF